MQENIAEKWQQDPEAQRQEEMKTDLGEEFSHSPFAKQLWALRRILRKRANRKLPDGASPALAGSIIGQVCEDYLKGAITQPRFVACPEGFALRKRYTALVRQQYVHDFRLERHTILSSKGCARELLLKMACEEDCQAYGQESEQSNREETPQPNRQEALLFASSGV